MEDPDQDRDGEGTAGFVVESVKLQWEGAVECGVKEGRSRKSAN